jgi:hypothetical protein
MLWPEAFFRETELRKLILMLQILRQWNRRRQESRLVKEDAVTLVDSYGDQALGEASRRATATRWHQNTNNFRAPGHWNRVCVEIAKRTDRL